MDHAFFLRVDAFAADGFQEKENQAAAVQSRKRQKVHDTQVGSQKKALQSRAYLSAPQKSKK